MLNVTCDGVSRRDVLTIGSAGILGLTLPGILASEAKASAKKELGSGQPKAKSVILLWLSGGPATIDMWDNKPDAPEGIRGEFKSIDTAAKGVQVAETFPKFAAVADKATIVRSLYHTIPSHGPAAVFMTTGNKPTAALQYPSMGSVASKLLKTEVGVPPYVTFGELRNGLVGQAGYLGTGYNPFIIEGNAPPGKDGAAATKGGGFSVRGLTLKGTFTLEELEKRDALLRKFDTGFAGLDKSNDLVDGLDTFHQQALEILKSDKTRKALDLTAEKQTTRDMYGNTPFGQRAGGSPPRGSRRAVLHRELRRLGHPQPDVQRAQDAPGPDDGPGAGGADRRPRPARPAGQHDRDVRRRVRPHPEGEQEQRARPLGAVDGVRAGRRRLQARLRPRHHRRQRHGPGDRAGHPGRRVRHDLPQPRHRAEHGDPEPQPAARSSSTAKAR